MTLFFYFCGILGHFLNMGFSGPVFLFIWLGSVKLCQVRLS